MSAKVAHDDVADMLIIVGYVRSPSSSPVASQVKSSQVAAVDKLLEAVENQLSG